MMVLLAVPFGLAIGTCLGLVGAGGSILALPVLVYVFGEDVHAAATASLLIVATGAIVGAADHHRQRSVCWPQCAALAAAAVPALVAGTAVANALGPNVLMLGFGGVMMIAAVATWRKARLGESEPSPSRMCPPLQLAPGLLTGTAVGLLTGFFGVGGGFLVVPALFAVLGLSMRHAVGTSLAVIAVTAVLGMVAHLGSGRSIDVAVASAMTAACGVGALAGSALAPRIKTDALGQGLAALIALVALYLLASTLFLGGPPRS